MTPLVSIVIPAYNHADYLDQAIRCVLSQDYRPVELIVLDDGSTDRTREVLAGYGDRFFWETHPNMGQAQTLNKGWRMARGEILGYLSADDVLSREAVRASVEYLARNSDAVACYCDFDLIDPRGATVRQVRTPEFDYGAMLAEVRCPVGPGAFFRRAAFERAGPWDPSLRQMPDYDFWLRLGLEGRFVHVPEVLAGFRVHPGSLTFSRADNDRADEPVRIVTRLFSERALPPEIARLKDTALGAANLVAAQLHVRAGRLQVGLSRFATGVRLRPSTLVRWHAWRMLANAFFNRAGHRVLWVLRGFTRKPR